MTDVFEGSDLQRLQNAINEANGELNKQQIREADIEKKDDQYNERLQAFTEPFAQELLRKPIEDAPKAVVSGAKKAIGKGLNYLKGRAEKEVSRRVGQLSERLGVPDLGERGSSLLSGDFGSFLPKPDDLASVASKGRATLASFNEDGLSAINRARASGGNAPLRTSDEPTEVDAFTGKPVEPLATKTKKPLFDDAADDDWTTDLYDKPITHTSRLFEDRPQVKLPDTPAPPSLTATEAPVRTGSLEKILPLDKAKEDLKSVDFQFKRPVQPKVKAPKVDVASGDAETLDQLAPMRAAMKTPNAPLASRGQAVNKALAASEEATPPPVPKPTLSTGGTQTEPLADGQATDDAAKAVQGGAKRVVSRDVTGAAEKAAAEKAAAKTAEKGVGTDIAEGLAGAAEGEAEAQGGLDPVSDIIALVAGLGTLFGGEFGKHHTITPEEVPTIASSQKGVY